MIRARAASTVWATTTILKPSSRWFPTASRPCVWGYTPGDCYSSYPKFFKITFTRIFIFRWGSGKSFLIELIKRKFDPRVKERKGSRELIQYFEDDFTDTNWKNPVTLPTNFTTFIWENNYVGLVQIDLK